MSQSEGKVEKIVGQYADGCAEEQLELLRTLGKIPAPSHQEERRAEFCRDWFLKNGAKDVTIDRMNNVICKIGCEGRDEFIVFAAHMDVVFPDTEPLPLREDAEKLYAPGIGDDTANLVSLMLAARYLLKNPVKSKYGFLIVANSCEEGLGNLDGTKELFAAYGKKIRAFYSFDGNISHCCSEGVGSHRYRVTCKARGGHSYADFGNPNAIAILCSLVGELYRIEPPKDAKTTFNVGRFEGGTTVNSIAQEASMLYEFRSPSQKCLETMEAAFRKAIEACSGRGGDFTVDLLGIRPGNGPVDQAALDAFTARNTEIIRRYYDGEMDFAASSTDSNVPLSLGILANTIGTVRGNGAHTREEWVDKGSLPTSLKLVLSIMLSHAETE